MENKIMKVTNTTGSPITMTHIRTRQLGGLKEVTHKPITLTPGEQDIDEGIISDLANQSRWQELINYGLLKISNPTKQQNKQHVRQTNPA